MVGVVGVIDESSFTKKGSHSAGVARQHNGRLGKEDNCQVGVFLIGVTPAGSAFFPPGLADGDGRLFGIRPDKLGVGGHVSCSKPRRVAPKVADEHETPSAIIESAR